MKRLFWKKWLHARGQKQAENVSFCVTDRRETKVERIEWLSMFEKWIDLRQLTDRRTRETKD